MGDAELAELVTRDSMIGVSSPQQPQMAPCWCWHTMEVISSPSPGMVLADSFNGSREGLEPGRVDTSTSLAPAGEASPAALLGAVIGGKPPRGRARRASG